MVPKDKRDPTWDCCHLNDDGKMICQYYCKKKVGVGSGGIHRLKQHLAHARGNVKPCLKIFDDLKAEMLGHIEAF
jgi:hypothetical protein